jgi:hypothetical protein
MYIEVIHFAFKYLEHLVLSIEKGGNELKMMCLMVSLGESFLCELGCLGKNGGKRFGAEAATIALFGLTAPVLY